MHKSYHISSVLFTDKVYVRVSFVHVYMHVDMCFASLSLCVRARARICVLCLRVGIYGTRLGIGFYKGGQIRTSSGSLLPLIQLSSGFLFLQGFKQTLANVNKERSRSFNEFT